MRVPSSMHDVLQALFILLLKSLRGRGQTCTKAKIYKLVFKKNSNLKAGGIVWQLRTHNAEDPSSTPMYVTGLITTCNSRSRRVDASDL